MLDLLNVFRGLLFCATPYRNLAVNFYAAPVFSRTRFFGDEKNVKDAAV